MENWDASFSESWTTADLVDCILSYAVRPEGTDWLWHNVHFHMKVVKAICIKWHLMPRLVLGTLWCATVCG